MAEKRKRDAAKTRENILVAAQKKFMDHGFDGVGVRDIANLAGVNIALVNRYFGSKEGLFREAIFPHMDVDLILHGEKSDAISNLCHNIAHKDKHKGQFDPMFALLRSLGSEAVTPAIREIFEEEIIEKLSKHIEGEDAKEKAAIITAILFGYDSLFRVLKIQLGQTPNPSQMEALLNKAFTGILN